MLRRIYSYTIMLTGSLLILISCDKNEEGLKNFSSFVDVSNSSIKDDKHTIGLLFSTDNGVTFVAYPVVKVGQKYQAKIFNLATETEVTLPNCFEVDWSASDPKPVGGATSEVAEFVMQESNQIKASVIDHVTPFSAASWLGTISAYEDYGSAHWGPYETDLTVDPSNPNRFHLDNFYDSGLDAYIDYDPATRTVKFPDQTVGGEPITESSGTFDQCRRQMTIELHYDGNDITYLFGQH